MKDSLNDFFTNNSSSLCLTKRIESSFIYNEFSLQFELAYFLRKKNFKVYFEKNVNEILNNNIFENNRNEHNRIKSKREIDLYCKNGDFDYFIELKFHKSKNSKIPETMLIF